MPKLFQTNILVILLAGFAFFMLGWMWYDMLFGEKWMALTGVTMESAEANMGQSMAVGLLLSLVQAAGIAALISMSSGVGVGGGVKAGLLAWFFFALPQVCYNWNYAGAPFGLTQIDASYSLVGYVLMGAVIGALRR